MDIKSTFDNEAEEYDFTSRAVNIYFDEALDNLVENILIEKQDIKILDICCGTAILTEKVAKRFPKAKFFGVDFSTGMLAIAKERMKAYDFSYLVCDICDEKGMEGLEQFDLVITSFGVHNIHRQENKLVALKNVAKHLKKGGQYITCDLIKGNDENECRQFQQFQRQWLRKTYNEKEAEEWLNLLDEEDEPETLEDNFKLLENSGLANLKLLWRKEFLGIWSGEKK